MKRNNKKGFTIVELVIVIAVIAILSAVLIPTFSGITQRAQETAWKQQARNTYVEYLSKDAANAGTSNAIVLVETTDGDKIYVTITKGEVDKILEDLADPNAEDDAEEITEILADETYVELPVEEEVEEEEEQVASSTAEQGNT